MNKMDIEIEKEEPKEVLRFFKEISNIPRKSGKEELIKNYLVDFAKKRNLECYTDKYFNVIIRKEAYKGYEKEESIAFQGHTDMICEKEEWSVHNFEKNPIELIKDGDFIRANGTTLGADNGVGVAFMLALLDSKKIKAPKIECIFTVQEETTMIGVKLIDTKQIKSKKIISLDNGKEGKMVISSANCMEWFGKLEKEYIKLEDLNNTYELTYSNFKGGHSGENIADKSRGNPIKLGMEILSKLDDVYISQIKGGSRVNVIPRDFKVTFSTKENIDSIIKNKIKEQKELFDKEVIIKFKKVENPNKVYSKEVSSKIIRFVNEFENGALYFSKNKEVILSANLGAINEFDKYIRIEYSLRSNDIKLRKIYLNDLERKVKENDIEIIWSQELKGFDPDYTSDLVTRISQVYKRLFNKEIKKIITQGVVEGGFFKDRIKEIQYVCIGANTFDVHSPKEKVSIKSIQRTWELIKEIIK